jgi:anionic cell wall polymer biosynthesis LytR-Cps2A-Psr (LCP) family protein
MQFQQISNKNPIAEVIQSAFDTKLILSGGWGYLQENATVIEKNEQGTPLSQFEHMLASMRAYLEMNMTLDEAERYGSINLNELSRETIEENGKYFNKVTYEISAMKESVYAAFINEYKERYGKKDFDLQEHFSRRKKETLTRVVTYWFEVNKIV